MIRSLPLVLLIGLVGVSGCDSAEQQSRFVEEASQPPSGIAQTDDQGNVIQDDPDDWRTSPLYATRFAVLQIPFPNPTRAGESMSFSFRVYGFNVIPGGVYLVGFTNTGRRVVLATEPGASSDGVFFLTFTPSVLYEGTFGGLRRVFLFDGRSELITYGDVQVLPLDG